LALFLFSMERFSPCKINLLLNILGRRADGFHELETVFQPMALCDRLVFEKQGQGLEMTCSNPTLPVNNGNLVFRAAEAFYKAANMAPGISIHLEKNIPLAAGLGGGSANAATTLMALNDLHGGVLAGGAIEQIAAALGSDVPFFLQGKPALGLGRGEQITVLDDFPALRGACAFLVHPGFGVSTAWAYQHLSVYPEALKGRKGRAQELVGLLQGTLAEAGAAFYNSLETPVLLKYPLLAEFQKFLKDHGASAAMMSGSGSTTFALTNGRAQAEVLREEFRSHFGPSYWTAVVPLQGK
jgi:4-diphosphocytidyl-2-C-methyl-D-erythritol kinase